MKDSQRTQKFGIANGEYTDNDYFAFRAHEGVLLDVGKTDILFLDDENYSNRNTFSLASYAHVYESDGVDFGSRPENDNAVLSLDDPEKQISEAIKNRTGELALGLRAWTDSKYK